jgi:hypothetical protein
MLQLDLKKLSKGMNIKDKLKLLFEDMNCQAETLGKESILTAQERKAIIDDARNTGEIIEIRRVYRLSREAIFISIDMEISELLLFLSISHLEKTLMGIVLKGASEDIIGHIIYDLARQNGNNTVEIDAEVKNLYEKYKVDSVLFKGFDFFNPPENTDNGIPKEENDYIFEPNRDIQKAFMASFSHAKKLKTKLSAMDYILKKSPIDFLLESTRSLIKESEDVLSLFVNLDSTLKPMRVYRDYGLRITKSKDPDTLTFFEKIQDIGKQIEMSEEDRKALESMIDRSLTEDL